jgi:RNA methyltransferase, TrmH family
VKVVRSLTNPGVKRAVKLRGARARRETGLFVVEGFREVARAIEAETEIVELWFCPDLFLGSRESELVEAARTAGAQCIEVTPDPFRKMSYRDRPEGLLAVCKQFDITLDRIMLGPRPLVLVVESIEKPGNLGTMIRAAGAAGADAVLACDPATDVFNPNVVRSSIGTSLLVPLATCTTAEAIDWLHRNAVAICAATPDAELPMWQADLRRPSALIVGSEQYGLSDTWLSAAEQKVEIPMPGRVIDSLNAAASAAILLFEAVRQRTTR